MMSKLLDFNNGLKVPILGLGTWLSQPGEVKTAVEKAIDVGYRHIDCAWAYLNENEVGEALEVVFREGKVKREDIFITSKLWNSFHRPEEVSKGFKESIDNLKLEYLDLYLIHWPVSYKPGNIFPDASIIKDEIEDVDLVETWKEMEHLVDSGKVKSIGISNFNIRQIQNILNNSRIKPAMLQVELHAYFPNTDLVKFCHQNGIQVTGYSPLGAPQRPGAPTDEKGPLDDPVIIELAKMHGVNPAQILISYVLHRTIVCIPKSVTPSRIEDNFKAQKIKLSVEEMKKIEAINVNKRFVDPEPMKHHKEFPF